MNTLEDRLADLFDRVTADVGVIEEPDRVVYGATVALQPPPPRRRGWMLVAATVVVVVAGATAVGVTRINIGSHDASVGQQPADPPGPLYVLPEDIDNWTIQNAGTTTTELAAYRSVVVGEPTADGFGDPVAIAIHSEPPSGFDDTWESVALATGPAFAKDEVSFIRVRSAAGNVLALELRHPRAAIQARRRVRRTGDRGRWFRDNRLGLPTGDRRTACKSKSDDKSRRDVQRRQ